MIEHLPLYVSGLFLLTTVGAIVWYWQATRSTIFLWVLLGWTMLQSLLGYSGIYTNTEAMPPRLILGILPPLIAILALFLTRPGRQFMDQVYLPTLTYFHTIRIPVEIVLILLYHHGLVSILQTFEGTNFDLFSGITAPLVAYFIFTRKKLSKKWLLLWNIICLLLLLNVVITSAFALPTPFQQIAFDQPNTAVLYFPFNLLPTVVVPIVLFAHAVALRQLLKEIAL